MENNEAKNETEIRTVAQKVDQILLSSESGESPADLSGDIGKSADKLEKGPTRKAYTIRETATILGVSYHSAWRLVKRGILPASKALRRPLIPASALQKFLDETSM